MASPIRTERDEQSLSLGALTPIVHVIKNAQTNATRDFDRFYDNLWAKLTPKSSNSRVRNITPDRSFSDDDRNSTSLTPLIQRHTLHEDNRYDYANRNPFYQDTQSEIAETPGLELETPMNYRPILHSPRRSVINPSTLSQKIAEEKRRLDKLQNSVNRIKRQSSFLADESSHACDFLFEKDDEEEEENIRYQSSYQSTPASIKPITPKRYTPIRSTPIRSTPIRSTPIRSTHMDQSTRTEHPSTHTDRTSSLTHKERASSPIRYARTERASSPTRYTHTSSPTRYSRISSPPTFTPKKRSLSPTKQTPFSKRMTSNKRFIVSPKRIVIEDLPGAKLRSTEMISTPGGSMVSNRFWKEIHGSPATTRTPITERISTLKQKSNNNNNNSSQTWANDDQFWSIENNTPVANSFNNKLFQVAKQEEKQKKQQLEQDENDMIWSHESPVSSSVKLFNNNYQKKDTFTEKLLRLAKENCKEDPSRFQEKLNLIVKENNNNNLSLELDKAQKKDDLLKKNNIPKMNPNLIAELKAKYQSRFIDDSDEYKFN